MNQTLAAPKPATIADDSPATALNPLDEHNRRLRSYSFPPGWKNPVPSGRYNLVVIGAGPAGLVAAAGAAGLGAKVALVDKGLLGGDCLNLGCVPSKALIRCARAAADVRRASEFGVLTEGRSTIDFPAAMNRMRRLRADLAVHDSAQRFAAMGVDVFFGEARFTAPDSIEVNGLPIRFAKALIATGARASSLPIEGLGAAGYLTNESVFSLTELPQRLAVIGAGPIGCELAQAFARFGAKVTLIEAADRILPRESGDAAAIVQASMARDGVELRCAANVIHVRTRGSDKILRVRAGDEEFDLAADDILIGVGRTPNVEALNLSAAGIEFDTRSGIRVNDYLQTTNPKVYAAGDVASIFKFTHAADAMARIVLRNALFFGRQRVSRLTIPWCTYTDPEVAHIGLTEQELQRNTRSVHSITVLMAEVDRAVLDGESDGYLRVYLEKGSDRILGATLVSRHAGETIMEIGAIMAAGRGLSTIANTVHPYPTQAEVIKKAADAYNREKLTPRVKRIFETYLSWRR